ncbi:hypothetical protein [Chitinophaga deserti]|uniref:hypothetical protein n=1 Tax=Chitinophaga deserti TaxID=2164099 RepID=UPI000D6C19B5|nr:hypothetical protein [Chitinophaga deserti]
MKNERDLQDNPKDLDKLAPEETSIDLPEVKDIPGQEHIHVEQPAGELADTTASSADEEGEGLLDDLNEDDPEGEDNVSNGERKLLDDAANVDPDDEEELRLHEARPDSTDEDGDPLNEDESLDVPGSEDDDDAEEIGSEDEENNEFSTDKNSD